MIDVFAMMNIKYQIPARLKLRQQRLKDAVRRDALFLLGGAIAYFIVAFVETHAADDEIRLNNVMQSLSEISGNDCAENNASCAPHQSSQRKAILDAGFILTSPFYSYLAIHRDVNDMLAMGNSILLTIPLAYVVYVTVWKGDFRLSFRLIATHLFRSLCGWFTYLPPDPEFLSSMYDFPEIFLCLFQECSIHNVQVNFVTFFSGHVATIVIVANHLYMAKHKRMSVCLHCFNWLQAIRLLATRGHYSIDLIIGYVVAAFVSSPADRIGLCYSRGILQPVIPGIVEAFEILVGVSVTDWSNNKNEEEQEGGKRALASTSFPNAASNCHDDSHNVQSETSVRIAVDIVADIAQMKRA